MPVTIRLAAARWGTGDVTNPPTIASRERQEGLIPAAARYLG
jgi:hypothetical protein